MPLPDFIIGGAPKAGTTAIFRYLDQHPGVFTTTPKEPHYFASAALGRRIQYEYTREDYEALFEGQRPDQKAGEGSTEYLERAEAVAPLIASVVPDVRLIFSLRNPIDRAYSYYWFRLHIGIIGAGTPFSEYRSNDRLLKAGDYAASLALYQEAFDREQILVLLMEDLRDDPDGTMRRICEHIGVDPSFQFSFASTPNVTRYPRAPRLMQTAGRVIPGLSRWASRRPMLRGVRSRILFSEDAPKPPMSAEDKEALVAYYQPRIEALSDMIDRDLSHWLR